MHLSCCSPRKRRKQAEKIRVEDENGRLLRYRTGTYNEKGQLTELRQYYSNSDYAENKLTYDNYGNISSVTDSRGAKITYSYDGSENMFVTEISQSGKNTDTYKSFMEYDIPFQMKKKEKDCNNNEVAYSYDSWQRIKSVRSSYDAGILPAVTTERIAWIFWVV